MPTSMFITTSYEGTSNKKEIEHLCTVVKLAGFVDVCFIRDVEHFEHRVDDPKELMRRAKEEIAKCDWLLVDVSDKPTGRAIEAGIAYALGKKIVVVMKKGTQIKDTVRGIADAIIEYNSIDDIDEPLRLLFVRQTTYGFFA